MPKDQLLSGKKAEELRDKISEAVASGRKSSLGLAALIHESYISTTMVGKEVKFVYESWGYKTWPQFIRTEVGMFKATANNWRKVWRVFGIELKGSYDEEEILPITKMVILSNYEKLSRGNVSKWLKKAKNMSCLDLRREVFNTERARSFSTSVTDSELKEINASIKVYRAQVDDTRTKGEIISHILSDWRSKRRKLSLKKAS
jgi:hypothetical protein